MLLIIAVISLLLSLLSPVFGYIFIVSVNGVYLYRSDFKNSLCFYLIIITGIIVLFSLGKVTLMEVGDIIVGLVIVITLFFAILKKTDNYIAAFFYAGIGQVFYAVFRTIAFGSIYKERLETFIVGSRSYLEENMSALGAADSSGLFQELAGFMIDYQMAVWAVTMLLAMYLAMVFLARKLDIQWEHHLIRFPYMFSYILILALVLAILPAFRIIGLNILLMISVFFLIQGLSIIDYVSRNHFKRNRFIMVTTVFLLIINIFFGLMIAALGLMDYWLDIRKLGK